MELELAHGREDPNADMDDRGFDGPILTHVHSVQQVYNATTTVRFATIEAADKAQCLTGWPTWDGPVLEMTYYEDMIVTHEPGHPARFYGDLLLLQRDAQVEASTAVLHVRRAERALREAIHTLHRKF